MNDAQAIALIRAVERVADALERIKDILNALTKAAESMERKSS